MGCWAGQKWWWHCCDLSELLLQSGGSLFVTFFLPIKLLEQGRDVVFGPLRLVPRSLELGLSREHKLKQAIAAARKWLDLGAIVEVERKVEQEGQRAKLTASNAPCYVGKPIES